MFYSVLRFFQKVSRINKNYERKVEEIKQINDNWTILQVLKVTKIGILFLNRCHSNKYSFSTTPDWNNMIYVSFKRILK